ncbi:M20/M25/M40 family metallo-hydrolase [Aureispira anguillae]|uniref:Carboxypeptidase Q n=1 Tax=Aureispira anguillae TaxID=2864201 RepID=A0A915YK88_9BACT|nr:M20/M25/M40 family metallo-hydrolase [Aureispira anguillae]BDS14476.1 M20/M25/M40 family metallo-hydrolase [Aureispira anguillae]
MMYQKLSILFLLCVLSVFSYAQELDEDAEIKYIKKMYTNILTKSPSHDWLHYLCKQVGGRLGGSPEYAAAVAYTSHMLDTIGCDTVWTQPVEVPYWRRGDVEKAKIVNSEHLGTVELAVAALGFSGGTDALGVTGEVVEVKNFEALEALGKDKIKGKIVFFNRPMDITKLNTFHAYGGAVNQRSAGPRKAAELGAIGAIVRSMTVKEDNIPHSGVTSFNDQEPIPAVGIGLKDADLLSDLLKKEAKVKINLQLSCAHMGTRVAQTVVGEIRGTEKPDEIILVGGHLDSWDIGEGAHDDGAGCVQSMEVLHLFKRMGIQPKHTIRCVLFANEENGLFGATEYAKQAKAKGENHIAAIESDAGGHVPSGFRMDAASNIAKKSYEKVKKWRTIFASLGVWDIQAGGSAADISRLKDQGTVLFGYRPDSQRYFDFHHSQNDVFENVHKRELLLGSGAMGALVYLIDKYGIKE